MEGRENGESFLQLSMKEGENETEGRRRDKHNKQERNLKTEEEMGEKNTGRESTEE